MGQFSGKTALVTGGNSGIGLATAQRFAAEGAHVFITGRNQKTLDDAVASVGVEATGIRGDVSNLDDLDNVADAIRARGRGLDVVFANAGGGEWRRGRRDRRTVRQHIPDQRRRNPFHAAEGLALLEQERRSC